MTSAMDSDGSSLRATLLHELEFNLWETWSNFGRGPGCTLHEKEDLLWFETPIPIIPFNGVMRFQVKANPDQVIESIVNHFQKRKSQFMWVIHPSSLPQDISERLQKRGLIDVEPIPGMARTLDDLEDVPPVPDGIEIRKVESDSDASAFIQFAVWRWNVPEQYEVTYRSIIQNFHIGKFGSRYHMWQAWKDDRPVSKAAMYAGSKSAGIYAVVTKPEAQRLGLARVLTLTALHEARSHGIRIAVLHSTPMAEKLYQSIGFETLAEFRLFASDEVYV